LYLSDLGASAALNGSRAGDDGPAAVHKLPLIYNGKLVGGGWILTHSPGPKTIELTGRDLTSEARSGLPQPAWRGEAEKVALSRPPNIEFSKLSGATSFYDTTSIRSSLSNHGPAVIRREFFDSISCHD
jgi:hypothetical protein